MNKLLAVSALGPDGPAVVQDLASAVLESGCNILESRISRLGSEIAIQLLVAGNWRTIARLEELLGPTGTELGLDITLHMSLAIPASTHIATLREDFMILCDELNLDAVLEPIKG